MLSLNEWAQEIFGSCQLGDRRLTARLVEYAGRQVRKPEASIHAVCEGSGALKEGTFRFLRNERVAPEAIIKGGCGYTAKRSRDRGDVLIIEDSTTMKYWHEGTEELGDLGGSEKIPTRGFIVHTALAVERQSGDIIGLMDQQYWIRKEQRPGRDARKKVPYEEKENFKWQRTSERIRGMVDSTASFVWVCDREADIYEYFSDKLNHRERFIVRAAYNRVTADEYGHLWERLRAEPADYTRSVNILQRGPVRGNNRRDGRSAREAKVEVRACAVKHSPTNPYKKPSLKINAVYVSEPNPPEGATALEWMLLTTEPIGTNEEIERVICGYEKRWLIEEFHRVWKTGCKTEDRRLRSPGNLKRLLAILSFIAVRIMQLRTGLETRSAKSCETVMPKGYWQCLHTTLEPKKELPTEPPTVLWAAMGIAKLAGWIQTKKGLPPGYLTLWKGWMDLEQRVEGWEAALSLMKGRSFGKQIWNI